MKKKITAVFLIIGILASTFLIFNRINVEKNYKNIEFALDFEEAKKLSNEGEKDLSYYLKEFKSMDINYVALNEVTLKSLYDDSRFDLNYEIDKYDVIIKTKNEELKKFIKEGFLRKLDEKRIVKENNNIRIKGYKEEFVSTLVPVKDYKGEGIGKRIAGEGSLIEEIGLGYLKEDIELIKLSGLNPSLRPINIDKYDDKKSVDYFFDVIDKNNIEQKFVLFAGKEVLGNKKYIEYMAEELDKRDIKIVLIENVLQREHIEQEGMEELVKRLNYDAVRGFSLWNYIQERYDYEIPLHRNGQEVMNALYRAITERNIRVIYFRPFLHKDKSYVTNMQVHRDRLNELKSRLSKHNIVIGDLNSMKANKPSRIFMGFVALLSFTLALIYLDLIFELKEKLYLSLLSLGVFVLALYAINLKVDLLNKLFALLGVVIAPSIAVYYFLKKIKDIKIFMEDKNFTGIIITSLNIMLVTCLISFMGVLIETSLLSHIKYLLELDIFRGVKISQLIPFMLCVLSYFKIYGYKRKKTKEGIYIDEIKTLLNENIKLAYVLILGIIAVFGLIYIARMGHETNIKPSSMELLFRNLLEIYLPARPRTKSLLIADPMFVIAVYLAYKNYKYFIFPSAIIITLGQGNIVNTFSHLRTPFYLSFIRTLSEMALGFFIGVILILLLHIVMKIYKKGLKSV